MSYVSILNKNQDRFLINFSFNQILTFDIFIYKSIKVVVMAESMLFTGIDKRSVNGFHKDIVAVLRVSKELDRYYGESKSDLDDYIKKFEKLIKDFNRKYKGLKLKLVKKVDELQVRMLLNEKNIKSAFENSASKVIGLQSIGRNSYGTVEVSNGDKFAGELEKTKGKLYLTYYNPDTGSSKVFLQYDSKARKVQLVYDEDVENEPGAEFQIAAFYALKEGYDKKIKVHDEAATFGFSDIPDYEAKREHLDRHDPYLNE
tara:strand:+ start:150 stop:926 length:777 start_codon:yes stop_codon:yes gene_type:complete